MQNELVNDIIERIKSLAAISDYNSFKSLYICLRPNAIYVNEFGLCDFGFNLSYQDIYDILLNLKEKGAEVCKFTDDSVVFKDPNMLLCKLGRN